MFGEGPRGHTLKVYFKRGITFRITLNIRGKIYSMLEISKLNLGDIVWTNFKVKIYGESQQ